ncbi:MAG: hypothetical protein QXR09_02045 [Candidatus Aenigmatarchaeota archaeon]
MKKSVLLGWMLILLVLSSTLIYLISSLLIQPSLPTGNIVEYELDIQQKNLALRQGRVLMEFFYGRNCKDCQEKISILESIANKYPDKVFLEKVLLDETPTRLHLIGFNITENVIYLQEKDLEEENVTEENIMNLLCEIMLYPPVECVKI